MILIGFLILIVWIICVQMKLNDIEANLKTIKGISLSDEKVVQKPIEKVIKQEKIEIEDEKTEVNQIISEKVVTDKSDFENLFMGNIFNKIGAIALIIGIGIFIKLLAPYIIFTPLMKILIGFFVGCGMIIGGFKIHKDNLEKYAEVLTGTGFAVLFTTVYCASSLFHLFSDFVSVIIGSIILIAAYLAADRQKTISMLVIALIGGYLNPFFISSSINSNFLYAYFIFLNLLSIIYVYKNPQREVLNVVNLLTTFVIGIFYFIFHSDLNIIYPLIMWVVYIAYDIFRKNKSTEVFDKNNILNWLNFAVLTMFTLIAFKDEKMSVGWLIMFAGLVYAGLAYYYLQRKSEYFKPYLYSMLVALLLSTFYLTEGVYRIALWSIEAFAVTFAVYKYKLEYLQYWIFAFLGIAVTGVFFVENAVYAKDIYMYVPVWNTKLWTFGFPVLSAFAGYKMLSKNKFFEKTADVLKFTAISLIYIYAVFELSDFITRYLTGSKLSQEFVKQMIYTIVGFKYALQTRRMYNLSQFELFKTASIIVGGISLIILLGAGYNYNPISGFIPVLNIRFAAFVAAIVTAVVFARWTKSAFYKYLAVILGFLLLHFEASDYIEKIGGLHYLISIIWILYAGIISIIGIFKNKEYLKIAGIWISILSIIRVFIYDLSGVDAVYKLAAFLTTGTILMIISYYYNRYKS